MVGLMTGPVRTLPDRGVDLIIVGGLGAAIGFAALRHGGFYPSQLVTVVALVAVAALARATRWRRPVPAPIAVAAGSLALFAAWAGDAGTAAVALTTAAALVSAAGLDERHRRVLVAVVLAIAVVVAASCWIGIAFRVPPLALPSSGLWRAASTLTYANATAAFLVITLLLAVTALPVGIARTAVVAVLVLGLLTTMSRAGAIGLAAAVAVLMLATARDRAPSTRPARDRPPATSTIVAAPPLTVTGSILTSLAPAVPAVVVAGAALLPSLPVGSAPQPWLAAAGLVAGAAVLAAGHRMRPRHVLAGLVAVAVTAAALLALVPAARDAATGIAATRFTAVSAERADLTRVTLDRFRTAPWTGVGPGNLDLRYVDHTGARMRAVFTHDEYLQTAAETGLVGIGLVVAALIALAVGGLGRRTLGGAAAAAAVAGFAVHSAFDFLWHIPVLPLLLAVVATVLITEPDRRDVP